MADSDAPKKTTLPAVSIVVEQMQKCLDACGKTLGDTKISGTIKVEAVVKTAAVVGELSQQMKISTHTHHGSNDLLKDLVSMNMAQVNDRIVPMISLNKLVGLMVKTNDAPAWVNPSADLIKIMSYIGHYFEACETALNTTEPSPRGS